MPVLETLSRFLPQKKTRDVALTAGGMLALLGGQKVLGLAMFGKGALGLEELWRERHPEFSGDFSERWRRAQEFYEETHQHEVNRTLHVVGIPMIVGGAAGLLLFTPFGPRWIAAAGSFTAGWVLNFIGHGVYEKKAPAFADDPLSFIAGPMWDLQQVRDGKKKKPAVVKRARSAAVHETGPMTPDVRPGEVPPPPPEVNVVGQDPAIA